jgi:dCTP diphosphatase
MPSPLLTLECVRLRANTFVYERAWNKFHTPTNLALAMAGEAGEISEIFQFKGSTIPTPDALAKTFTEREMVHIGEEVADVFIYSTRLAEVCGLDLGRYVSSYLEAGSGLVGATGSRSLPDDAFSPLPYYSLLTPSTGQWGECSFAHMSKQLQPLITDNTSIRHFALRVNSAVGQICELFASKDECASIESWPLNEQKVLAYRLAGVIVLLSCIASLAAHNLGVFSESSSVSFAI